jgi:hypothetical protein
MSTKICQASKQVSTTQTSRKKSTSAFYLVQGGKKPYFVSEDAADVNTKVEIVGTSETESVGNEILCNAREDVERYRKKEISATELKNKYPKTYTNWDGMKARCRMPKDGQADAIKLDSRFLKFADFLFHMGPRPTNNSSLDRKDPTGPYYLENVRWASKQT